MNTILKSMLFGTVILGLASCASGVKRGVVAMKVSDTEAHVGIGQNEVAIGDHVELYRNQCSGTGGREGADRICKKVSSGHGEVTRIFNKDYSVVKFPNGTKFAEGDMVEKHGH